MDEQQQQPTNGLNHQPLTMSDDGEIDDETPAFIDPTTAVEVQVDDTAEPMDDDEEGQDASAAAAAPVQQDLPDMSKFQLTSHTGPLYATSSYYDTQTQTLSILTGGGDDKAYLHHITPNNTTTTNVKTIPLTHVNTDSISTVAFNTPYVSSDLTKTPKLAGVGSYDGTIILYDPDNGEKKMELEGPSDVEWLCFHPKGGTVLLAGSVTDGTIWMYHTPTSKCLQVFVGHEGPVNAGSFTPDGRFALSAGGDGTLRIWAPKTGLSKHVFRFGEGGEGGGGGGGGLTCLGIGGGNEGQLVMVGSEDGMAYVCHLGGRKVVSTLRHYDETTTQQQQQRRGAGDGMDVDDDEEEDTSPRSVEAVGFASPTINPNWCATGGVDGTLKIWDLGNNGQCRQVCRPSPPPDATDEQNPSSGGDSSSTTTGGITRLKWHPTQPLVFASYSDGTVRLWDARSGGLLQTLTGHSDMINDMDVQFVLDGNEGMGAAGGGTALVVTGSDDKAARVFEVDVAVALSASSAAAGGGV